MLRRWISSEFNIIQVLFKFRQAKFKFRSSFFQVLFKLAAYRYLPALLGPSGRPGWLCSAPFPGGAALPPCPPRSLRCAVAMARRALGRAAACARPEGRLQAFKGMPRTFAPVSGPPVAVAPVALRAAALRPAGLRGFAGVLRSLRSVRRRSALSGRGAARRSGGLPPAWRWPCRPLRRAGSARSSSRAGPAAPAVLRSGSFLAVAALRRRCGRGSLRSGFVPRRRCASPSRRVVAPRSSLRRARAWCCRRSVLRSAAPCGASRLALAPPSPGAVRRLRRRPFTRRAGRPLGVFLRRHKGGAGRPSGHPTDTKNPGSLRPRIEQNLHIFCSIAYILSKLPLPAGIDGFMVADRLEEVKIEQNQNQVFSSWFSAKPESIFSSQRDCLHQPMSIIKNPAMKIAVRAADAGEITQDATNPVPALVKK